MRFKKIRKIYSSFSDKIEENSKGSFTPLDGYLISEKITLSKLKSSVSDMGQRATAPFRSELKFGTDLLERILNIMMIFIFFATESSRVWRNIFPKLILLLRVKRTLGSIGFDFSKIHFDTYDRPNKYPSPICFFVKIPDDTRVLYKSESPYFNLQKRYHETGHAIHASSIDPELSYWEKYKFSMGMTEIFSILIERLTRNPLYLKDIGITNDKVLSELVWKNKFMELFFVVFYAANSLMKMEFWKKNLTIYEASRSYEKLIKKYMGLEVPGEYWMLHHILPESIMYVPSYMIAAIRAAELERYLTNRFGEKWWNEPTAGKKVREIMSKGERINLKEFSKLDPNIFMKEIGSR